jgi:hypothetical protein
VLGRPLATAVINLSWTGLTHAGLDGLCAHSLSRLQYLALDGTRITDRGLLPSLRSATRLIDRPIGLEQLAGRFSSLTALSLRGCYITDDGITPLKKLPRLKTLSLEECRRTTEASLASLGAITTLQHLAIAASPTHLLALDRVRLHPCSFVTHSIER